MAALVAGVATWLWLDRGFAQFDDGAYAWAMRELWEGKILHLDIQWAHPGYVLWILLPFQDFLSQDILHYRYPLPFLAAIMAFSLATLLKDKSPATMVVGGLVVAATGFLQFATYSASWFAVTATAAAVALAFMGADAARSNTSARNYFIAAGFAAGMAFGFRGPNGVAALMAIGVVITYADQAPHAAPHRLARHVLLACLALTPVGIALLCRDIEQVYFALPAIALGIHAFTHAYRNKAAGHSTAIYWTAAGFLSALAPLIFWLVKEQALSALLRDIIEIPQSIDAARADYRSTGVRDLIAITLEIISAPKGVVPALTAAVCLVSLLIPAWLCVGIYRDHRPSAALVLACFSMIGILAFPAFLYFCYLWPFAAIVYLSRSGEKPLRTVLMFCVCMVFIFVTPKGLFPGSYLWLADAAGPPTRKCTLANCSVSADARVLSEFEKNVRILSRVPAAKPLIVLPSSASFAFFLDNPMPFTLSRADSRGTYEETASFRQEFMSDPDTTIAVQTEHLASYTGLLNDYCASHTDDAWTFLVPCPDRQESVP